MPTYEIKDEPGPLGLNFGTVAQRVARNAKSVPTMAEMRTKAIGSCRRTLVALRGARGLDARCDAPIDALIVSVGLALRALGIKGGE